MLRNGDELKLEKDFKLQILWPREEKIEENILNNNSIVAKLYYKNFSILFTGDIEEIAEKQIVEEYKGLKINTDLSTNSNKNLSVNDNKNTEIYYIEQSQLIKNILQNNY